MQEASREGLENRKNAARCAGRFHIPAPSTRSREGRNSRSKE